MQVEDYTEPTGLTGYKDFILDNNFYSTDPQSACVDKSKWYACSKYINIPDNNCF